MKMSLVLKMLKWTSVAVAALLIAAQFVRPARTNPPIDETRTMQAHAQVAPQVAAIFERACRDCHSHQTRWPWYSRVAPVSWFVIDHVNHGRQHLNFDDWASAESHGSKDSQALLDSICKEVQGGRMPLASYTLLHPRAKLSEKEIKIICQWATSERRRLASQTGEKTARK